MVKDALGRFDIRQQRREGDPIVQDSGLLVWCGVVWCDVMKCGVVWCGVV